MSAVSFHWDCRECGAGGNGLTVEQVAAPASDHECDAQSLIRRAARRYEAGNATDKAVARWLHSIADELRNSGHTGRGPFGSCDNPSEVKAALEIADTLNEVPF